MELVTTKIQLIIKSTNLGLIFLTIKTIPKNILKKK
tara:strand:+ start:386 stop:493 length:108 start_codon:yes stop_codon:yes gene_type:complete